LDGSFRIEHNHTGANSIFFREESNVWSISSRTNVRQVCGFTDKPTAWMRLTKKINALPSVRKAGLYLTPADMADVTTVAQIARSCENVPLLFERKQRESLLRVKGVVSNESQKLH
jgi:hypothetical protein